VIIDPGDEVDSLLAFIDREHISIKQILLTHAHVDHVTGVARAKRACGVPIHLHREDLFLYERAAQQGAMFGIHVEAPLPSIDAFYGPDDVFTFGDFEARPYHTPGHCPGGVCLTVTQRSGGTGRAGGAGEEDGGSTHLFVGDTLFAGSIGRTDLPGGDYPTLIRSITTVLFAFGDAAIVYPGHGPTTTIGAERRTNPFLT
jgi:glyoxylase-like metal-dependent hydrolase (beta-lactamase superfamily II)